MIQHDNEQANNYHKQFEIEDKPCSKIDYER